MYQSKQPVQAGLAASAIQAAALFKRGDVGGGGVEGEALTDRRGRRGETVRGELQLRGPALVHLRDAVEGLTVFILVRLKLRKIHFLADFTAPLCSL